MKQKQDALPRGLSRILGTIQTVQWECPGIHYVEAEQEDSMIAGEYYVVTEAAFMLSSAARRYGQSVPERPELLFYNINQPRDGQQIVNYEINRYRQRAGIPLPKGVSLKSLATYGHELNPEYFGRFPVPALVPGSECTLRYWAMENGIYWLETESEDSILSICYPMCEDLSDATLRTARLLPEDRELGIDQTMGYRFFSKEDSCLPIFELLVSHPEWSKSGMIDSAALMNAVNKYHPNYFTSHNWQVLQGLHDPTRQFAQSIGLNSIKSDQLPVIILTPEKGTDFYRFPGTGGIDAK